MTEHLTPHERAAMRGSFIYRDKGDRVTAALLYASQTSAKARKLARELRRIHFMREPFDAEAMMRPRIVVGDAS